MTPPKNPNLFKWSFKYALSAALAGILCCVAPAILFMFGLMSGVYAISFADFFYNNDGSTGTGAWALRITAICIGLYGIYAFRKKQNQCSIDPKRKRINLILLILTIIGLGIGLFLGLEHWSAWYFDAYIVPAQQQELNLSRNF